MADEEILSSMLRSIEIGDGNDSQSSSPKMQNSIDLGDGTDSGSSSSSSKISSESESGSRSSGSLSGSGSDDSAHSVHPDCRITCVTVQLLTVEAFNKGKSARAEADLDGHTTLVDHPATTLLNSFNTGWNDSVENLTHLSTLELTEVGYFVRLAGYSAGLILDSLYDNSETSLPTSQYQDALSAWQIAGFCVGRYLLEEYRYEKHLEMLIFTDFFTNERF